MSIIGALIGGFLFGYFLGWNHGIKEFTPDTELEDSEENDQPGLA